MNRVSNPRKEHNPVRFFEYPVTGDRAEHAARGVGAATDYACPIGTIIDAPFSGVLTRRDTRAGGLGLQLTGDKYIFVAAHLSERVTPRRVPWRSPIAKSGNTGDVRPRPTRSQPWLGAHVHAWIVIRATGQRISFGEWLRDYVYGLAEAPAATPTVRRLKRLDLGRTSWYWYRTAADAGKMRNPQGKRRGQIMLTGPYPVLTVARNGAVKVRSNSMGSVWLHASAARYSA